eukprot:SAG11_NODE_2345_length_3487_cov_1.677981_6_plen_76_part_00
MMFVEFVKHCIVPAGLAREGGQALAATARGVRARDDRVVADDQGAVPAPHFAAAAHENVVIILTACLQQYVEEEL